MQTRAMKYNPAFLSDDALLASFVLRKADLALVLEAIRENTGPSSRHFLIIGPRGSGKTTLVLRAAAEVRRDPELSGRWYPIVFGEESYQIATPGEFWLEAIFHLATQTGEEKWRKTYDDLKKVSDETTLHDRALSKLQDFSARENKRLLLVVENLNMLLGDQISDKGAWVLRHTMQNEPNIMLLATATARFKEIDNIKKAMFEVFRIHDLKPVDVSGCLEFWQARTGDKVDPRRIRPVMILTGGNPRLLTIISSFAKDFSLGRLLEDLMGLVDDHTEYFKSHLDALPAMERKVYIALADLWDPSSAAEVAREARMPVNKTSAYLGRLVNNGAVVVTETKGRTKWYQVAERMYNIYYLLRRRGDTPARVRALVNFMMALYEQEDLLKQGCGIAREAVGLGFGDREIHYRTFFEMAMRKDAEFRKALIESTPIEFFKDGEAPEYILSLRRQTLEESEKAVAAKGDRTLLRLLEEAERLADNENTLGEAEKAFRSIVEKYPNNPLVLTEFAVFLHFRAGKYKDAEPVYRSAFEAGEVLCVVWFFFGKLLHEELEKYPEAEAAYLKAIELKNDDFTVWLQLGQLLHKKLGRYEEAEVAYRKAIELDGDQPFVWTYLGQLLHEGLGRFEEAEVAYRKAIELDNDAPLALALLGVLLSEKFNKFEEAVECYRKILQSYPDSAPVWCGMGTLLHRDLGRFADAETAYRKAIALKPQFALGWHCLGLLLDMKLGRFGEAAEAYVNAQRFDPHISVWGELFRMNRRIESELDLTGLATEILEANEGDAGALNNFAKGFSEHGEASHLPLALEWARKAVSISPNDHDYLLTLASILTSLSMVEEAMDNVGKLLADPAVLEGKEAGLIELLTRLAAAGDAGKVALLVEDSPSGRMFEPLVVGLRLFQGEKVRVATEILEVGKDIAKKVEDYREEYKRSVKTG